MPTRPPPPPKEAPTPSASGGAPPRRDPGVRVVAARLCDAPDPEGRYAVDESELGDVRWPGTPEPARVRATAHAGLIVQREGRLHALRPWVEPRLTVGRANDCEIVLPDAGISRRHALLERRGDVFEVVDLGSVNGTTVNGRRVERRRLSVGDVVRLESFSLTFVLDERPIGELVHGPTRSTRGAAGAGSPRRARGRPGARPPELGLPVADLLLEDPLDDEEKEEVPRALLTAVAATRRPPVGPAAAGPPDAVGLGVEVRAQDLSRRMRLALELLEATGGSLPVTLSIRRREPEKR